MTSHIVSFIFIILSNFLSIHAIDIKSLSDQFRLLTKIRRRGLLIVSGLSNDGKVWVDKVTASWLIMRRQLSWLRTDSRSLKFLGYLELKNRGEEANVVRGEKIPLSGKSSPSLFSTLIKSFWLPALLTSWMFSKVCSSSEHLVSASLHLLSNFYLSMLLSSIWHRSFRFSLVSWRFYSISCPSIFWRAWWKVSYKDSCI